MREKVTLGVLLVMVEWHGVPASRATNRRDFEQGDLARKEPG